MNNAVTQTLKLLSDETRLRLLVLLEQEELSVRELVEVTQLGQSTISHHLSLLRNAGLVADRKEGTWNYSRFVAPQAAERSVAPGELTPAIWRWVKAGVTGVEAAQRDQLALEAVRQARQERSLHAHDRLAGVWRLVGQDLERGSLRAEALAALAAGDLVVADLGCGAGFFTHYVAERVARVIAVDQSSAMLQEAQSVNRNGTEIEFRRGSLDQLPLQDDEVDAVVANLVFHHLADFEPVVAEIARVTRPGGSVVISDLRPHGEEWMREEMADLRLGIEPHELVGAFAGGPFENIEELPVEDRYQMRSTGGKTARLDMFLVRARKSLEPLAN